MKHDIDCEGVTGGRSCFCDIRRDVHRFQAENWQRVTVATESEKDEVLRYLNDHDPDVLRDAMDETGIAS